MFFYLIRSRTTLEIFVTYLTGALHVHPLWFCKHQHDNRVPSKLFVACQRWWFQWRKNSISVLMFVESQRVHIQSTCKVCNKHLECCSIKLKEHIYSYLKCIVYDKLLKPRQSFRITVCIYIYFYDAIAQRRPWSPRFEFRRCYIIRHTHSHTHTHTHTHSHTHSAGLL